MNDFYIGYLPKLPATLAKFVRRTVIALALIAAIAAITLTLAQKPFASSFFEYGNVRAFEGALIAKPYPVLLVMRPGKVQEEEAFSSYLLVAPGKHGANDLVAAFDGKVVHLKGQLIHREQKTMIEVEPGSITTTGVAGMNRDNANDFGVMTLTGEIVDSKCYLGVMNPGSGKVHRDCAARCISGGIPPILITSDGARQLLLVDREGQPLKRDALRDFIAEPITLTGRVVRSGEQMFMQLDAGMLRHTR
jgi:hypothetical protein